MRQLIALSFACIALGQTACASSKVTAFRDPAHPNAQFSKLIVFGFGMHMEAAVKVEQEICKKVAPTPCVPGKSVLPPTREYPTDEIRDRLQQTGADGLLILALISDNANVNYIGTYTNSAATATGSSAGTVNLYGNTAYWSGVSQASAEASTWSAPVYGYSREARGMLSLFEIGSGALVWSGELRTSGKGMLTVTDSEFIRSATNKIAADMKAARLLR